MSKVSLLTRIGLGAVILWATLSGGADGNRLRAAELSFRTTVIPGGSGAKAGVAYRARRSALSALQFDLQYDQNILAVSVAAGDAAVAAGKVLTTVVLPTGNLRVVIFGFNQTVIADGNLADLRIQVSASASPGPYTLRCVNIIAVTPAGEPFSVDAREGNVVVIPGK